MSETHEMDRDEYVALSDSCNFLEHYHLEHSDDIITRFRGKDKTGKGACDIYVVSDPEWKRKLREATAKSSRKTGWRERQDAVRETW